MFVVRGIYSYNFSPVLDRLVPEIIILSARTIHKQHLPESAQDPRFLSKTKNN